MIGLDMLATGLVLPLAAIIVGIAVIVAAIVGIAVAISRAARKRSKATQ